MPLHHRVQKYIELTVCSFFISCNQNYKQGFPCWGDLEKPPVAKKLLILNQKRSVSHLPPSPHCRFDPLPNFNSHHQRVILPSHNKDIRVIFPLLLCPHMSWNVQYSRNAIFSIAQGLKVSLAKALLVWFPFSSKPRQQNFRIYSLPPFLVTLYGKPWCVVSVSTNQLLFCA